MMKITMISLLLVIVASGLAINCVMAKEPSIENKEAYSEIKIYFVPWEIITRVGLSPGDVRRTRHLYMEIKDEVMISTVVDAVYHDDFHDRGTTLPEDARLVIDFIKKDGVIETVYANQSHIINGDSSKYKDISNELLKKIGSLIYLPK